MIPFDIYSYENPIHRTDKSASGNSGNVQSASIPLYHENSTTQSTSSPIRRLDAADGLLILPHIEDSTKLSVTNPILID
jgi:hypothetical protein